MQSRHPHVFGSAIVRSAEAQTKAWETLKAEERRRRAAAAGMRPSALDGVPLALPALTRAAKLQKRAARVGFDWPDAREVVAKVREEIDEVVEAAGAPADGVPGECRADRLADEIGDLLFAAANLARHYDVDPEAALRGASAKFERRFRAVETALGVRVGTASLDEMEKLWQQAKSGEREAKGGRG
jgi:ATP diphosphatase